LQSMVFEGVFEEFPNLRVVLVEAGIGWAPSLAWALDSAWEMLHEATPHLQRRPSEYVRDHVWYTTQPIEEPDDPRHLLQLLEHGRLTDRVMFATDYPHWDFDSPKRALPRVLGPELTHEILAGTASRLYGLTDRV